MYGYGYGYKNSLVVGANSGGGFTNTYSLDFDGTDDRLQLSSDFVASGEFTLSFWMKPAAAGSGNGKIYPIGTFPDNSNYVKLDQIGVMWLRLNASNAIFNEAVVGGGANNLVLDTWQHIAFIRDSSNVIRCYRNGSSFGGTATNSNTLTLNSFGRIITNTFGFEGGLDEIAFWNSDETANLSTISTSPTVDLTDLSPTVWLRNGDNGAYKSPQWLLPSNENKDKISNYSFELDGVDDYVDCGDSDDFSFGNGTNDSAFSISAWVKMDDATNFGIISKSDNTAGNSEYLFYTDASNRLTLLLYTVLSVNRYRGRRYSVALTEGVWMHLVATYDGQGGTNAQDGIKIYLNGARVDNTDISNGAYVAMPNGNAPLEIGVKGNQRSNGNIDEVAIFNSELSATAINDIYNGGEPTTLPSGAVAHYLLGEEATFSGGVWTVPDAVGSNDGTSNAMTIEDRVGEAPSSDNNALSYNMDLVDRVEDTP